MVLKQLSPLAFENPCRGPISPSKAFLYSQTRTHVADKLIGVIAAIGEDATNSPAIT